MKTSSYDEQSPTDSVVLKYEKLLESRIAEKILQAAKKNSIPPTFTEEETAFLKVRASNLSTELVVETPSPSITIKQGNTELNIGQAAEVVKRMEQTRPNPLRTEIPQIPPIDAMAGVERYVNEEWREQRINLPKEIQKSNKNAYEIRLEVLNNAMAFLQWKSEKMNGEQVLPTDDAILMLATKFYKFVENRR